MNFGQMLDARCDEIVDSAIRPFKHVLNRSRCLVALSSIQYPASIEKD